MASRPNRFDWRNEHLLLPILATLAAAAVLFPLLGSYGLWDPQEITVADAGRELANKGGFWAVLHSRPPLQTWLIALAVRAFGTSELSVRVPLAFLGFVGALATYALGARLRRPRVGLYAVLILCASPLFVFESRQLTSGVALLTSGALALLGLAGLTWPARGRHTVLGAATDALLVILGLGLGFLSGGLLLGVLVPLCAAALAAAFSVGREAPASPAPEGIAADGTAADGTAADGTAADGTAADGTAAARSRLRDPRFLVAVVGGALAVATALLALAVIYDLVPGQPGRRAIFGKTLAAAKGYLTLLGGAWRTSTTPPTATFDVLIEQVAFGMFPWSALAPLAVLRLAMPPRRDRDAWGGLLLVFAAAAAYVVGTLWVRKVGELHYPALPAIAVAVAIYVDDVLGAEADPRHAPAARALPLAALFTVAAAAQLARDLFQFPEELLSIHLLSTLKFPTGKGLLMVVLGLGLAFAAVAAVGLAVSGRPGERGLVATARRVGGKGLAGALGIGYVFGAFLALGFTPAMSQHFSYRNVFQSYFDHRGPGEPLAVMGIQGSGPDYYARGAYERLAGRSQLVEYLRRPSRVFAIAPAGELCAIHQAAGASGFGYHVLDNRNSRFLLLTNRLGARERDDNPLLQAIRREPPERIGHPLSAKFEDRIELLGYDMPDSVGHGDTFRVTAYFKVIGKPSLSYKIFVHFDTTASRFQGDHDPIRGRCATTWWQPGDYVIDTFDVKAGELTNPRGHYTAWIGFFTGSHGQWKNMQVTSGNGDANNRVRLGSIRVR